MTENFESDPQFLSSSTGSHQIIPSLASSSNPAANYSQNSRKKRSKFINIDAGPFSTTVSRPKYVKKPDPSAPKITRPCTECGKKFWSWKALFGHMRCHPERQWRGINPPPNYRRSVSPAKRINDDAETSMTVDDHEVAACLLMLATGAVGTSEGDCATSHHLEAQENDALGVRFECSSCKKVFGSHQALGGHRASHKNVKGCFAINRTDEDQSVDEEGLLREENNAEDDHSKDKMVMMLGHKCSICLRVFSSGQALGGHKRCHWEKGDDTLSLNQQGPNLLKDGSGLDLNLPAPIEDDSSSSYSSGLTLDLRLGL